MIKVDIVNEVSKIADITKVKAEVAVDAVFDAMRTSMQRGERIELRGFGVFYLGVRKKQMSVSHRVDPELPDLSAWHQRSAEHSDRQDHTFDANDLGTIEAIHAGMTLLLV